MKRLLLLPVLLFFTVGLAFSLDFGLLFDQKIEAGSSLFSYTPVFTPWFSWNGGNGLSVYFSAPLSLEYKKYTDDPGNGSFRFIPELGSFAAKYRFNRNLSLEAGRIWHTDTLGFTASGLFDGLRFDAALFFGNFSAAVFYTGFQYKETAMILMTESDTQKYSEPWENNFGAYFASSRVLAAIRWDMPIGGINSLSAEILAQFDLNGSDQPLNSQYGEIKFNLYPKSMFMVTVGALFETLENEKGDFSAALGVLADFKIDVPGSLNDRFNAIIKITSGSWGEGFSAFTPVSSIAQGAIFQGTLSGLALLSAGYSARLHNTIFAEGILRYFISTYDDPSASGIFYGGEVWASFVWQPLDDIRLSLGGGVFLPVLGDAFPDDDLSWKINAVLSLSF